MKPAPRYTVWLVFGHSPSASDTLRQHVADLIKLDRVLVDKVQSYAGGVERVETVSHRLGDYFEEIYLLAGARGDSGEW